MTSREAALPGAPAVAGDRAHYQARAQAHPDDHAAWHELGLLAFQAGDLPQAIKYLHQATHWGSGPTLAIYHRNLGEMHRRAGQAEQAVQHGLRAAELAPQNVDVHYNLGLAYGDLGDMGRAIVAYRQALSLNPRHNLSWNNLGSVLEKSGDAVAALEAYRAAAEIEPKHAEAHNNAGAALLELGRLDEARVHFEQAVAARPEFVEAHYNLSALKTYKPGDPHLAQLEQLASQRAHWPIKARIRHGFALGKAREDIGQYDRAFAAYQEANQLQFALSPPNEDQAEGLVRAIIETFDKRFFAERASWTGAGDADHRPVFIVGMPRSGTTLLEQILASHGAVYGAGERDDFSELSRRATGGDAVFSPARVKVLTEENLHRIGQDYLDRLWALAPGSRCITDKMPANFFLLGLIHLALPHARIIHAMRDPMDSCLSCYGRLFSNTMEFAYDLGTLGRYYDRYARLMAHWHKVLPGDVMLDLAYEDMVADTEGQARRVLAFLGLPWSDDCLRFHENQRVVKTASVAQVRQPIYAKSVARWKHFARHLAPLYEIVKQHRPNDDAAACIEVAAASRPAAETLHAEGIALYRQDRFAEALARFNEVLSMKPQFAAAFNSRGFVLQDLGRTEEARQDFQRAVDLAPEMTMARLNLGMAQLKLGDFEQGWANYEARWSGSAEAGAGTLSRPPIPIPAWQGEPGTAGKRLLVITEQGFGDTFQMARYLPLLASRFERVGFACSPTTQRLMEWSFAEHALTLTHMPVSEQAWAGWDLHCHLMSLPRAFGTGLESIPARGPYLTIPRRAQDHWRERVERAAPGQLRVGLAWTGRAEHQSNQRRSLTLQQLAPLLGIRNITWFSLQKWMPGQVAAAVPPEVTWFDWTDEQADFADAAALVANLDLVISIDSVMVHLAGALGKPVWMLDRFDNEWRWLTGREDSPWYPSLRIFRQTAFGEWSGPVHRMAEALRTVDVPGRAVAQSGPALTPPQPAEAPRGVRPQVPAAMLPAQAIQLAAQHQSAGRLADAEVLLRHALQAAPGHPHALHLLGVVSYQAGQADQAIGLIEQAIQVDPGVALFHSNLAEMLRQRGDIEQAIVHGERAVQLDPSMASAWSNLGIAYYDAKAYDKAQDGHAKALALVPHLLQSMNNMGSIARARQDSTAAADWYRKALSIKPDYVEAMSNLGAVLIENDQMEAAEAVLLKALKAAPQHADALCNLGLVRLKQDKPEEAGPLLRRSLQQRPAYPEAMVGLARALHQLDKQADATRLLQEVVNIAPDHAEAWRHLGTMSMELGEAAAARDAYRRALELVPGMPDALIGLGNLRLEAGAIDEAVGLFHEALDHDADSLGARFHLAQARTVTAGDPNLDALQAFLTKESDLSVDQRISLHYALGKSHDDLKAWDRAFPHFLEGARLKRGKIRYDARQEKAGIDRIIEVMDADFVRAHQGRGDPSSLPVFVLGMPRSGTTLTEQIIASHPRVFGAGELPDLMRVCQQQPRQASGLRGFPDNLLEMQAGTLAAWGQQYVEGLARRAPDAERITDKMPANYIALGLIPLMLPNARIVHVRRNPVDTCISCFTRLFNRHQDATYDLQELGRHYVNYARLMDHWRAVLPAGSFLEVRYEDIVADMEAQARRLIDFTGLEWDDACLSFHKTSRSVRTASVTQVRQPIYKSSVARWRHYEKFITPLLDALGDLVER